jgi:Protein of unknown function (DUF3723)
MGKINLTTVKKLKLRVSGASSKDAKIIRALLRDGTALAGFPGLIPSLFTFFKDIDYLEFCSNLARRLKALLPGLGIFDSLQGKFTGVN